MTTAGGLVARHRASLCLGLMVMVLASGCYRPRPPAALGQAVRVEIVSNDARLVRSQPYLQQAVTEALANTLGWTVSPTGPARLQLTIEREDISASGTDVRNTPNRWIIELHGQMVLTSARGNTIGSWTGSGYASALSSTNSDEPSALKSAATSAAVTIATTLEAEVRRWP